MKTAPVIILILFVLLLAQYIVSDTTGGVVPEESTNIRTSSFQLADSNEIDTSHISVMYRAFEEHNDEMRSVTKVRYINGMNNLYTDAQESFTKLLKESREFTDNPISEEEDVYNIVYNEELYNYDFIYNYSQSFLVDLVESYNLARNEFRYDERNFSRLTWIFFRNKMNEQLVNQYDRDSISTQRTIKVLISILQNSGFEQDDIDNYVTFVDTFDCERRRIARAIGEVAITTYPQTSDSLLSATMRFLHSDHPDSVRIVMVAHSQGNFYTTELYSQLGIYRQNVGIINVATPSRTVTHWHWTNHNDSIMLSVPFAPDGKMNYPDMEIFPVAHWDSIDPMHHDFVSSYMNDNLSSRDSILTALFGGVDTLIQYHTDLKDLSARNAEVDDSLSADVLD